MIRLAAALLGLSLVILPTPHGRCHGVPYPSVKIVGTWACSPHGWVYVAPARSPR